MRLISTNVLKEGMVIGRTIWNEAGHPLLQKDVAVNGRMIDRLKQLNIQYLYIDDQISNGIEIEETVSVAVRKHVVQKMTQTFTDVKLAKGKQSSYILDRQSNVIGGLVDDLLNSILTSDDMVMILSDAYLYDEYIYHHSLQVTLYALSIAKELGYTYDELRVLGTGAMLHDIGKLLIPTEILLKPDSLTEEEFSLVKKHARFGFDLLRNLHSVSLLVAHCAFQHHERLNGSGYPRGLRDTEIHPYAKIIAVADVFDAVTSNRVYRKKVLPSEGIAILEEGKGALYDAAIVDALKRSIVHYPNGSVLLLSDQTRGIVSKQNPLDSSRPRVRIFEKNSTLVKATYEIDLFEQPQIEIVQVEIDYIPSEQANPLFK